MTRTVANLRSLPRWVRALTLASAGGVLLGILGPFGSYLNGGPLVRIAYWVASMWIGLALYGAAVMGSARLGASSRRTFWAVLFASVMVASLPQALLTRALAFRLWPELVGLRIPFGTWYFQVVTVSLVTVIGSLAVLHLLRRRQSPAEASPSPASSPSPTRPTMFDRDVLALQMEDHYVRVHTRDGSELVLMPLGRAIEAVSSVKGLRTHRSWWVARHAVDGVEGSPRSMNLRLTNGVIAPVARNAVASLRAAGWLEAVSASTI